MASEHPEGTGPRSDVAIVGAGPTGLFAAALLARAGVAVRILDKAPGPAKESRAFAVQARSVELLASIGLGDAVLDRGTLATGARIYVDGREAAGFGFAADGRADTPYPLVLVLSQSEMEAILVAEVKRLGIAVERGVTIGTIVEDQGGVTLAGTGPRGEPLQARAGYVIGADGAHSVVRKAAGLTFAGAPYAQGFLLADCRLEGLVSDGPFCVFLHGRDFALWFPMKGEQTGRVLTTDGAVAADPSLASQGTAPATLADVEASFRRATQRDVRLSDATWTSRYRVHHRSCDRYRVGRVFVAGDAAHIHSPAGGQGMNTGLQDVANLAWKLAIAVQGEAPSGLLDSYDAERRPVGETVLRVTDRAFSFLTSASGLVGGIRDVLLPLAGSAIGRSGLVRNKAFGFLSQLGIRYEPRWAVQHEQAGWSVGPSPGRRAPDAAVARGRSVFDLLDGYRFTILALSRKPLRAAEIERLAQDLDDMSTRSGLRSNAVLVGHSLVGRHARLVQAETDAVLSAYGLTGEIIQALYLVRPDGHVAWRAPSLDVAGCEAFMAERFGRVTPS